MVRWIRAALNRPTIGNARGRLLVAWAVPIVPIPCLEDNYAYAVFSEVKVGSSPSRIVAQAVVVDPSDAGPVVGCLERLGLGLGGLLLTHHHWDHVGGVLGLRTHYGGQVPVLAHRIDGGQVPGVTRFLEDNECFVLAGLSFEVMHVPGHTLGAVAFRHEQAVFSGDTLFAAGCGRLFEGTAAEMYCSLNRFAALPKETEIYCGHEYALQNLAFARAIEPDNSQVVERLARVRALRDARLPSVPSTVQEELETNPFLRCDVQEFRERAGIELSLGGPACFAQIRARRDAFRA